MTLMPSRFFHSDNQASPLRVGRLGAEVFVVVVIGAIVAMAANQLKPSDARFDVTRNYFKVAKSADANDDDDDLYQLIDHDETMEAFQSPAYEVGQCIFIDARNDTAYAEKHIPGAYQLDHYYADRYLPNLLPACAAAERIIVYCNGGKCEDSKLATSDLIENGVVAEKIFVYVGGVVAWGKDGLPFERGERLSGDTFYDDE
jgi:rhodanese-related sulfurtransferase